MSREERRKLILPRPRFIISLLFLIVAVLIGTGSLAWFAKVEDVVDLVTVSGAAHAFYFNGGDGSAPDDGTTKTDYKEPGTKYPSYAYDGGNSDGPYQIDNAIQLYNFAWLQYLGYFNQAENGALKQTYFVLTSDIDLTTGEYAGLTLPPVGTEENPFLGNFNGNGYTIKGLKISNNVNDLQNSALSGGTATAVNVPEQALSGGSLTDPAKIVGFFGIVGEADGTSDGTVTIGGNSVTYSSAAIEVRDVVIQNAEIKTQTTESLAGIAAGYVNGTMENVRVVGGTLVSGATASVAGVGTTNLTDYGAVGYCTEPFRQVNEVTTVQVYDPQAISSGGGGGATPEQGNNWGASVDMRSMYNDLRSVYTTTTNTSATYASAITRTHHADGTITDVVTGNGTAPLSVTAQAGNGSLTYPIKVTEVDDNGDVIASYSIVQRDDTTDFVYLYGEETTATRTQEVHHIYEYEKPAVYIYSGTNYLTFNGTTFGNATLEANATKWVIDGGNIYTIIQSGDTVSKYYIVKTAGNTLGSSGALAEDAAAPAGTTAWTIGTDEIYSGQWYLCYKDGFWQLIRKETNLITESTGTHYLTISGSPAAISDTVKASALPWVKSASTDYTLTTEYNGTTYYLMCDSVGTLTVEANPATPTVWNNVDASGSEKAKIYTMVGETEARALVYDDVDGWSTTTYFVGGPGSDWGGSIDIKTLNTRIYNAYEGNTTTGIYSKTINDFSMVMSRSSSSNPTNSHVVYRHRRGTLIPINMDDNFNVLSSNTGYFVGSNIGTSTSVNASPKSSSYNIDYIARSLSNSALDGANIYNGTQARYTPSTLEVLTYSGNAWHRITDSYNSAHSSVHADLSSYSALSVDALGFEKYNSARDSLNDIFTNSSGASESKIHGIHFDTNVPALSDAVVADVSIFGKNYTNYPLIRSSVDFNVKEPGRITFFAGTYYAFVSAQDGRNNINNSNYFNDSFFSLNAIERDPTTHQITSVKKISRIYKDADGTEEIPYIYQYSDGSYSATRSNEDTLLFDTSIFDQKAPVNLALYYFEIPVNAGEYAMGAVSASQKKGAYLIYLDIAASAAIEGDSLFDTSVETVVASNKASDPLEYTTTDDTTGSVDINTYPTYYPLAWNQGHTAPASTNTGYVVSGGNTDSAPPGDIRVSRYNKNAAGNWASIRASLANGVLNNGRVYTIVNGTQQTITQYGIGNQLTTQYEKVSADVNDLLRGETYVYGMHFMQAQISATDTVTVPKAVINGTTYTDYAMPQDSIDFHVATKGRVTFMAGTYFSGSNGTQSFFSLHHVLRDSDQNITAIKELAGIYGDGDSTHNYVYSYVGDTNYYNSDGTLAGSSLPSGYAQIFDTAVIRNRRNLTMNSVYYFEVPLDAGEFALGSADGDGAYLIYLDIAANADFSIRTTTTETTRVSTVALDYPKGVAFVDAAGSVLFDTEGSLDPSKSVFLSLPTAASAGTTTFAMSQDKTLTVTNTDALLTGYAAKNVPADATLVVTNSSGSPATINVTGTETITETVTSLDANSAGGTVTTTTVTTQTTQNGATSTEVVQNVATTSISGTTTTVTTSPAPAYDGHSLIPTDYTGAEPAPAAVILEYNVEGMGLTHTVTRDGSLNLVATEQTVSVTEGDRTVEYTVFDAVRQTGDEDSTAAGKYDVVIGGTAGTYDVYVTTLDTNFDYTMNTTAFSVTGRREVTVQ